MYARKCRHVAPTPCWREIDSARFMRKCVDSARSASDLAPASPPSVSSSPRSCVCFHDAPSVLCFPPPALAPFLSSPFLLCRRRAALLGGKLRTTPCFVPIAFCLFRRFHFGETVGCGWGLLLLPPGLLLVHVFRCMTMVWRGMAASVTIPIGQTLSKAEVRKNGRVGVDRDGDRWGLVRPIIETRRKQM